MTMNRTTKDLKAELEKSAATLRALRDEVRVQIHLGGLDVKDAWRELEPRLETALGRAATEVSDASRTVVAEVTASLRSLRESLR
jgi:hypothetical protein